MNDPSTVPVNGTEPVIEVEDLKAAYGDHVVLENIRFRVQAGEIFVIVGGSGCGKSTLLKYLIGLYQPAAGRVRVNGVDIARADERTMKEFKRQIGVLFQSSALIGSMTLAENVALPLQEHTELPPSLIDEVVRMKLSMVNLSGYEDYLPAELSGGMRKRAGLARAMALDPTILFFDEMSAGLDPVTAVELDMMVKSINEGMGTTMVVVTHELESIFNIASRAIMLDKATRGIIAEGRPRDLQKDRSDPRVYNFFNRLSGSS
ncbi:MAG: ATP-binding cassette domain-containing protein [Syntrophaceae bacterium]|nr:ATP-binding cassette domain-containing protein [Syntrophaceae bacterium]